MEGDLREGKGERLEKLEGSLKCQTFVLDLTAAGSTTQQQQRSTVLLCKAAAGNSILRVKKLTVKPLAVTADDANHFHSETDHLRQEAANQCPQVSGLSEVKQTRD